MLKRFAPQIAFALGIVAVLIAALIAIQVILAPPPEDLRILLGYMLITSLGTLGAGYILYRLGWWRWPRRIFYTFLLGLIFQSGVVFFNVWLTARGMLINQHDLELTYVLLLFGIAVGIVFGGYAARALALRIRELHSAAQRVAAGDLSTRVEVKGRDELAELAGTFNHMTTQLESTTRQRQELDKLRRDLIAGASHDLRTPITSMRVVIEALADGLIEEASSRQRYLASLQADIASLSKMIDELFELAQIDAGGLQLDRLPAALRDLISDVMMRLRPLAEAQHVQLDGDVTPDVDPVTLDPAKMERVLVNLISNALRHTPAGGCVDVKADRVGNQARIQVSDTGSGIASADLPYVFDRFYRGDQSRSRATGGAGLGLAIAKGIVEAHGGSIGVQSQPGRGTTFEIRLPREIAARVSAPPDNG